MSMSVKEAEKLFESFQRQSWDSFRHRFTGWTAFRRNWE